jgi:hypothetical protein
MMGRDEQGSVPARGRIPWDRVCMMGPVLSFILDEDRIGMMGDCSSRWC